MARATSSAIFRRRASKRSRTAWRCRATPPSSASPTGRRPRSTAKSSRSTSIRIGRCRRRSCSRDLIPKMQDQPDYLTSNHIRIFDGRHRELQPSQINWYSEDATHYSFKQDPGSFNSLGSIRINFPSAFGVYMHDTPLKNLFGDDFRFHSSGCVRVQNVRQLVAWLLERNEGLVARGHRSGDQVRRAKERRTEKAGAAALGLHHRVGDARRRRAIPRGHLRQGRLPGAQATTTKL